MTIIPERIARLPKDKRGYPIPWNVARAVDGAPVFTVNDDRRAWQALEGHLCPICGGPMGRWSWWVGGPLSAFDENGWYLDLPGHRDCMRFALAACPYLAMPKYLGRIDVPDPSKLPPEMRVLIDETMIPDRPEVFVAVGSDVIEVQGRGLLVPYTRPLRPFLAYEFWRHGKQIGIEQALPFLRAALGVDWTQPEVRAA